ncbi:MAG: ferrochelatase, partial [Longimicrobiales bacterium]
GVIVEMKTGVVLLNFGEPEQPAEAEVVPFLERIFTTNASLERAASPEEVRARSHELAIQRAPVLIDEYRRIGGSPLNRQATRQADALRAELAHRGQEVTTYVGMQFTEPSIQRALEQARADGVNRLVALPVYPLCGASTTVAALAALADAIEQLSWDVDLREITGWHTHALYTELRADGIRRAERAAGVELGDRGAMLVFSAHGTPVKYLREGSRYDHYVLDCCARVAAAAGVGDYEIGYQNLANRAIEWTQPDIEELIDEIDAEHVVVVPISFMHEQSETLAELDIRLRERAEARGTSFHRVPIPHDDARFAIVLADLVEQRLGPAREEPPGLFPCRCRPSAAARCRNAVL